LKKEEFMKLIEDCQTLEHFDQSLLDKSSAMFEKWGLPAHETWAETDKEYLFKNFGLADENDDGDKVRQEKKILRCIASKIMGTQITKANAIGIMKNFNKIKDPGFRWLE